MAKEQIAVSPKVAKLLRRVVKHILDEPLRYDQNEVLVFCKPNKLFNYSCIGEHKAPSCGTVGCLAGWVTRLSLSEKKAQEVNPIEFASQTLGLSSYQRASLFGSVESWPAEFRAAYMEAETPKAVAKVAAKRVEHFIKTGE